MNYNEEMNKILNYVKESGTTPKLLLHSCCAPCSSTCLEILTNYFDITILYYNPNIQNKKEYELRKAEEKRFIKELPHTNEIKMIDCDYTPLEFAKAIKGLERTGEGGTRCFRCYELRLEKTAQVAKENNFDYFATTLTLSPYKRVDWLNKIGDYLAIKYDIKYLPSHFGINGGYERSIELSQKYNLYQQDYCGCVYSQIEDESEKHLEFMTIKP